MRIFLIIFGFVFFVAADSSEINFSKNYCQLPGDSLVSISDFGASTENDDNTDAFREAFKAGDKIFIPKANSDYKIQGKLMIPRGKTLTFEEGGVIDVKGILNGYDTFIKAGNFQIFTSNSQFSGSFQTDTLFCEWLGTVGDGVADDFEAMDSFFNLTEFFQFDFLKFGKNKKYYLGTEIDRKVNKPFILDGNGSTLIRDYKDISGPENLLLKFEGVKSLSKPLSMNLKAGDKIITLDNTIGIEAGMGLVIYSKELYGKEQMANNPDGSEKWHYHNKGMMSKVVKVVDAFTVEIADEVPYNFNAEQIKMVDFYDIIPITIQNLNFSLVNPSGQISLGQLFVKNLFNLKIIDCKFVPNAYSAIRTAGIYNGLIKNIYIQAPKEGLENVKLGAYGIVPTLNVNTVFDNIYSRAITHGIAFSKEPSYGVIIKNSNLKAMNAESNGLDSHSSLDVRIENSEIWGSQGNWGTFEFVNCKLHNTGGGNTVWNERASGGEGRLNVVIRDSEIRFENQAATTLFYMQTPKDSSNTYQLSNCKVILVNLPNAYTNLLNPTPTLNPGAKIKTVTIESCSFSGITKLFFPRKLKSSQPYLSKGTFTFRNNTYDNLQLINLNDDLFGNWLIEGNKPIHSKSNFQIDIQNKNANFIFDKNQLVGNAFTIQNNAGSFIFKKNTISNSGKNIFINNENSVFQNNTHQTGVQVEVSGATN